MRPGAPVDPRLHRYRRAVSVGSSAEGLARLRLHPEDLSRARPDLADIRVVDAERQQWPYLLEPDAAHEWVTLGVVTKRAGGASQARGGGGPTAGTPPPAAP
jgi:hypothetical protein